MNYDKSLPRFFRLTGINKPYKEFKKFCLENEPKENEYFSLGYETFGIILYNYCRWLMKNLSREGIHQVLFFSRDGYIMKKAFEMIPGNEVFDRKYIYLSRRSLRVPTLWFSNISRFNAIFPTRFISIKDLFSSIGLDSREYAAVLSKNGLSEQTIIRGEEIENNKNIVNLLDEIWLDVEKESKDEYEIALEYLRSFELEERVACVDIGWRGTMQNYLNQLIQKSGMSVITKGYYITLNSDMLSGVDMRGYLMSVDNKSNGCDLLRGYVGLIETLFLKTEGSTKKYVRTKEGNVEPELEEYEYMECEEYSYEAKAVSDIQNGAIQFICDYVKSQKDFLDDFDDYLTFYNLNYFATNPSLKDVKMFADFRFYNNGTISYLARSKSIWYYLFHIKQLKEDFYGSRWRIGFMKNLFRVPIPYKVLIDLLMIYVKKSPQNIS